MAHPQIAAFARLANGNAIPTRAIGGQNTRIARTIHGFAYNPVRDEIVVPQFYAQAILTFRGEANGDEAPIRVIQGPDTQLTNPEKVAIDTVHKEVFVSMAQDSRILVFPSDGSGNVQPIRILQGPDTLLAMSSASSPFLAVDPVHDLLIAGNDHRGIMMFDRTATGNTKPRAIIGGPRTQIASAASTRLSVAVYPPGELVLAGVKNSSDWYTVNNDFVGVWSIHDNGDVPPRWIIGGPGGMPHSVYSIAVDPKNKSVIVADHYVNGTLTYYFPEIF